MRYPSHFWRALVKPARLAAAALCAAILAAPAPDAHDRIKLVTRSDPGQTLIILKRHPRHLHHRVQRKPRVIVVPKSGGPVLVPRDEPFVLVSDPERAKPLPRHKTIVVTMG